MQKKVKIHEKGGLQGMSMMVQPSLDSEGGGSAGLLAKSSW